VNSVCVRSFVFLSLLGSVCLGAASEGRELFRDMRFRQGFLLSYPDSSHGRAVEAVLNFDNDDNVPIWRLCQWGTKHSLAPAPCARSSAGDLSYENKAKRVVVGGPVSTKRDLILEVRSDAEYGMAARKYGQAWPHLLIEQDAGEVYPLDTLAEIRFAVRLRLLYCTNHMTDEQYDPGLHAAQCQMFFIVKNITPGSEDAGDFYWFGVPFYDSRHDVPPAFMARDAGKDDATGKFIYTIDGNTAGTAAVGKGRWVTVQTDLLARIKDGLKESVRRGYLHSADPRDYAVVNMNLGWEMPGTFSAALQVCDLSIRAVPKERP